MYSDWLSWLVGLHIHIRTLHIIHRQSCLFKWVGCTWDHHPSCESLQEKHARTSDLNYGSKKQTKIKILTLWHLNLHIDKWWLFDSLHYINTYTSEQCFPKCGVCIINGIRDAARWYTSEFIVTVRNFKKCWRKICNNHIKSMLCGYHCLE